MIRAEQHIRGADLSSLAEVEEHGGRFTDRAGRPGDAMEILHRSGVNLVRLRLWNDPYDPDGTPYGAGTNDLKRTMQLARRARNLGMDWMLNIHYSDFWADPGKQPLPKAWRNLNLQQLEEAVYQFTFETLQTVCAAGLPPAVVGVGNELSNGLLWPHGKRPCYDRMTRLLSAGVRAVRDASPDSETMLHLDDGGNNWLYREWFDSYLACGGEDFDIIGLSYYPFWHGSMDELQANMNDIAVRYGKDLLLTEVSTGFTLEDYADYEQLAPDQRKGMAAKPHLAARAEYPMTPEGQRDFLRRIVAIIRQVPEGRGRGFLYWEPAWIPVPGVGWASEAALRYTGEKGPGGNEWANQALFDYSGRALPAMDVFRELR